MTTDPAPEPMTPQDVQRVLDENFAAWVLALDLSVTEAGPDGVTLRMPMAEHLARVGGIVSGQALAALADTAMVLAAIAHAGAPGSLPRPTCTPSSCAPAPGGRSCAGRMWCGPGARWSSPGPR
ncbi:hypothetical protein SAMN05444007_105142 [Cribrihabitans marinus]|uniref:Thioesterase domain-containing protein n=1 Tax=Cribrihabitans marinus TaxID=1227549 RepID=A0A1H6ZT82_9RHOB|nr:hypothetical protein GCM10010973_20940 [Cribrihabitans marinus]SEJ52800.1 hypothetical protein SAMN05444007_105142 [Cribrihabitans marinus]